MTLLALLDAELAFGLRPLLDRADFALESGERVGLIGRNGTGKSSLLRVLAGELSLDAGRVQQRGGLRVVMVEQEPVLPVRVTLREAMLQRTGIGASLDERERWQGGARLDAWLDRYALDPECQPQHASGGERKRAALAGALALEPDLLLLDEPTNHLDIAAIEKLEDWLIATRALVFVTHDRQLLDRVATRIVELDRGRLRSYPGSFSAYERTKANENLAEDVAVRRFEKFWAQEEVWIRKGVEARRTRNAGRVLRLEQLRATRAERRERLGSVQLGLDAGERSGRLVAEFDQVTRHYGTTRVVEKLDLRVMRGDRIGLIGPNGAGKSTLIGLLLGTVAPDSGRVRLGTGLTIAYFDQMRAQLDPEQTIAASISPGSDWVEVGGARRHIASYLADFLFAPERAQTPVKALSGGERNRLLLARLFARPANLLVLDEPTNDLDIDTLELLEQKLQDYTGTLLLVSHDRSFLDNIVTQTLVAEGDGRWREYVGGYSDWLAQRPVPAPDRSDAAPRPSPPARAPSVSPRARLSYREQRELEACPREIEALEAEQRALLARMQSPDYYRQDAALLRADSTRLAAIETALMAKLERWEALEQRARGG